MSKEGWKMRQLSCKKKVIVVHCGIQTLSKSKVKFIEQQLKYSLLCDIHMCQIDMFKFALFKKPGVITILIFAIFKS